MLLLVICLIKLGKSKTHLKSYEECLGTGIGSSFIACINQNK